jgi:hypothetical protein
VGLLPVSTTPDYAHERSGFDKTQFFRERKFFVRWSGERAGPDHGNFDLIAAAEAVPQPWQILTL